MQQQHKVGLAPGSLVYVGEQSAGPVRMRVVDFDASQHQERVIEQVADCEEYLLRPTTSWIDVEGVHDSKIIGQLGTLLGLHPLTTEDLMNTRQRPKLDVHPDYIFCGLKIIYTQADKIIFEHVGMILKQGCVFTFRGRGAPRDVFDPVRHRARDERARLRSRSSDYLFYALLDAVVDNYFPVLEEAGERIAELETEVLETPHPQTLQKVLQLKRSMLKLRRAIWPLREVIHGMERSEATLIKDETGVFLRDVYDHAVQIVDTIEGQREMLSEMVNLYLSSVSNLMNDGMRMLAVIATIFMPLTLIAGVYGMNFEHMPELKWTWSYPVLWLVLISTALGLVFYFKRQRWI